MTESYQPQINLAAYESSGKQKAVLRVILGLSVLAIFVLGVMYYAWFVNSPPAASSQANAKTSDTSAEKERQVSSAISHRTRSKHRDDAFVSSTPEAQSKSAPGISQSTIKSPVALEVISGSGRRQLVGTRDDSIYLNSADKTATATKVADADAGYGTGVIKAAEQTRISSGVIELPAPAAVSADPLLAKQQTIEGSVVLLAHIDKDGNIQNVRAISGPEILFAAAREAVKQSHFKPHYESGQAVETETQITVKFDISAH